MHFILAAQKGAHYANPISFINITHVCKLSKHYLCACNCVLKHTCHLLLVGAKLLTSLGTLI